jgi:hypothetical protein
VAGVLHDDEIPIERCRALGDFAFDLDAAERLWDEAMMLPGAKDRLAPRWYHGDLAAENWPTPVISCDTSLFASRGPAAA